MRRAIAVLFAWLAAALWVAPAVAATTPGLNLAAWVSANTDLPVSQIAIAGPDNVYSVEPVGQPLPTGEVLALVRTEALSADWGSAHQFQSWDAHLLFDCKGGRVRVLRSASYSEHNRGGVAKEDERGDAWFSPDAAAPASKLLAAVCDANFAWPLRGAVPAPSSAAPDAPPAIQASAPAPSAPAVTAPSALQVARLAPEDGAAPRDAASVAVTAAAHETTTVALSKVATLTAGQARVAPSPAVKPLLQKVNFIPTPVAPEAAAPQRQAADAPSAPGLLAVAADATRTCRRIAGEARTWIWRRVEVAWSRHDEPAGAGRARRGVEAENRARQPTGMASISGSPPSAT